jgi:phosphoglycolate phosphatase
MKHKLIFFDLDGTLVDSLDDLTDSINYIMQLYNHDTYSKETVKKFIGNGAGNLLERCFSNKAISIDEALHLFLKHYYDNCTVKTRLYTGVIKTLKKLKTINIILTNKPFVMTKRIVDNFSLNKYFKEIITPETFNVKKPHILPIKTILNKYNISTNEALIVGDSNIDIQCGNLSGIKVICVDYGFAESHEIEGAFKIISNFEEILKII